MIELRKVQLQESLNNFLLQEHGLSTILEMTLNSLMYCERKHYLQESKVNKGNGYRRGFAVGMGKQIELRIPRDRLGLFQPMVLALIRDQKQQLEDLSFELYGNGLTTRQIDAIHLKIRRRTVSSEAFYILLGVKEDYTREVIGIVNIPSESPSGWKEVLTSIKQRGVEKIGLIISDNLTG